MTDLEIYKLLVTTANIISKTKYASRFTIKGGLVLVTKMFELNRSDLFRKTTDIDIHCSNKEFWSAFCRECITLLNNNSYGIIYTLESRRADKVGFEVSDSLKFNVRLPNGEETTIKMDMNIKSDAIIEVGFDANLNMRTYSELTMIADKIVVVSSQSIYRRVKDLYDLCVLVSMYDFKLTDIADMLKKKHNKGFEQLTNMLVGNNLSTLMHAYDKYKGIFNKPQFSIVWDTATKFLIPLYTSVQQDLVWSHEKGMWNGTTDIRQM